MSENYLDTTIEVYKKAAEIPQEGLCCTTNPQWQLPGLSIPGKMLKMNYGCGSTVHPRDLVNNPKVLYAGVGGGMELLQFAYFSRGQGHIIGIDVVDEMLEVCGENLELAKNANDWFKPNFVELRKGSALSLPVENETIDVAAQNCLFNIFTQKDLELALAEMHRVLKPYGRLIMSDPTCEQHLPMELREDDHLRALCLSGALPLQEYLNIIASAGFGTIEVRAKRPYRILPADDYAALNENIFIESVEICAIKDPMPADGPCVFTGRSAIYFGNEPYFDDHNGHVLLKNQPLSVCDKTAKNFESLDQTDLFVSDSTWFYDGGGCC